jgi:hypothetical protein
MPAGSFKPIPAAAYRLEVIEAAIRTNELHCFVATF